jgi:hypothetical protein
VLYVSRCSVVKVRDRVSRRVSKPSFDERFLRSLLPQPGCTKATKGVETTLCDLEFGLQRVKTTMQKVRLAERLTSPGSEHQAGFAPPQ